MIPTRPSPPPPLQVVRRPGLRLGRRHDRLPDSTRRVDQPLSRARIRGRGPARAAPAEARHEHLPRRRRPGLGSSLARRGDLEGAEAVIRVAETAPARARARGRAPGREHTARAGSRRPLGVPAHITILYPFIPPAALDDSVERKIAEVLRGFSAFDFELRDVRTFADGVVYLAPEPVEPFTALTNAFAIRWPEYPPYDGSFTDIVPHLTVAMSSGAPVEELADELPRRAAGRQPGRRGVDDGGTQRRRLDAARGLPAQRRSNVTPAASRSQVASVTPSSRSSYLRTRPTGLRGRSSRNSM